MSNQIIIDIEQPITQVIEVIGKGPKGDKGEKGDAFTYTDFTPAQISELQKPATDKAVELDALEMGLNNSESLRVQNENDRITNEQRRRNSENNRVIVETSRVNSENIRISNENSRVTAENTRISNEETRNTNEIDRSSSENSRKENEVSRIENENERVLAETERNDTETVRISNENTRISSENIRNVDEQSRVNAENIRVTAENSRSSAENNRVTAENSRSNAENIRINAETERASNESGRKTAETARVSAENTRTTAETSRTNAEITRVNSENTRISNENSRVSTENTRISNENNRISAENTRVSNENNRATAESLRVTAENERIAAENEREVALNLKVDKVAGKQLSTEDYTTTEKNKLAGIQSGAEVNVNADWNSTTGDAQILNKPTTFPPSTHTHVVGDVTGLQTALDGKQNNITLTTTGNNGSATLVGSTVNIPTYTLAGLGGVPTTITLTINGITQDLSTDKTFNVGTVTNVSATSPLSSTGGNTPTISIQQANGSQSGFLSSTDWNTFNNKQNLLTNPVTGTGTANYIPKFTASGTIGNSLIYDNGTSVGIGTTPISEKLEVGGYVKATGFKTPSGTANQALTADGGVSDLTKKADLVGGKVPSSQLPSYVDDVLEFANLASFPAIGESGKIYIAIDTNLTYRWGGSSYVIMTSSLALGETSSTAYRGDRGKIAYDHSQVTHDKNLVGLGNVDNTSDLNKPISTATQNALVDGLATKLNKGTYTGTAQDLKNDIDSKQQKLLSSFDESILIETDGNIEGNVSLFQEYFEQQECVLNFTPIQIIGVYVNGIKQKPSSYTITLPKKITVVNFTSGDYIEIQYTHLK
jgi:hypothetical protein